MKKRSVAGGSIALAGLSGLPGWGRLRPASLAPMLRPVAAARPRGAEHWILGLASGPAGVRRYRLFRPPGIAAGERRPMMVMLHGCHQDAESFALGTRMNRLALRERIFVLYPEQDRRANPQGCWNWYGTRTGQAHAEAATLMAAIDQVCRLYPVDAARVAIAGLSAGASMAALMAVGWPARFAAVAMHSGIAPGTADSATSALWAMRGRRLPGLPAHAVQWPALLVVHGDADRVVAAGNARAAAELWAGAAGAAAGAERRLRRGSRHAMAVTDYKVGARPVATLCMVAGLGHAWSGGAPQRPYCDPRGPDASALIWSFASRRFGTRTAAGHRAA